MSTLFAFILLISMGALVVGLVRPSLVRLASRKRVALVFGGAILVSGFIVGATTPNLPKASTPAQTATETSKPAATTSPAKTAPAPVKTATAAPAPVVQKQGAQTDPTAATRQQLEQLVYDAVHGTNANSQPYIRGIDTSQAVDANNPWNADGSPNYTRWTVGVSLNIDGSKTSMDEQMAEIFYSLYSHRKDLYTVEISSYEPLIDKYGNQSDQKVYHAFFDGSDAYKVNWNLDRDTLVYQVIPGLWTVNFDASAINPNLLSK